MLDKIIYPKAFMKDWTKEKKNFQRRTHFRSLNIQILKNKQTIKETKSIIEWPTTSSGYNRRLTSQFD